MGEWKFRELAKPRALLVTVRGVMTPEETFRMASEVLAEASRLGITRFLVDEREIRPDATTVEIYAMPHTLQDIGLRAQHRVAIIYPPADAGSKEMRFFETVARNQGLQVSLFPHIPEALEWLTQSPPDPHR